MAFTVTWAPAAERALTGLWLSSRNRTSLSEASNRIDELLRTSPMTVGESRTGRCRVLFVDPLGIEFMVFEEDCRVVVFSVWLPVRRM